MSLLQSMGVHGEKTKSSETIEFIDDYANYTDATAQTQTRYEHDITVVSGEAVYVSAIMKNNKTQTSLAFRTNFSSSVGIDFTYDFSFIYKSAIINANITGASKLGYQQNIGTPITDLSMSFKQSYAIKLSNFATPPTQTKLDEIIQTYLLYKDEDSMVETAKYAQYLTGDNYIDNNLYVEHVSGTNLSKFIIHRQAKYGDGSAYLSTEFMKSTIVAINSDVYHLQRVYLSTKIGDSFFEQPASSMVINGEWECAIKESGAVDFIGGTAHGDENMTELIAKRLYVRWISVTLRFWRSTLINRELAWQSNVSCSDTPGLWLG